MNHFTKSDAIFSFISAGTIAVVEQLHQLSQNATLEFWTGWVIQVCIGTASLVYLYYRIKTEKSKTSK